MVTDAGNSDEPRPAEPSNGDGAVEGGSLPQPDPASFTPPEPDIAALAQAAQAAAEAERPFHEAKEALEELLHFGPQWGPRLPPQELESERYGLGNIVGVGIAEKVVNGRTTGTLAVTVYVTAKVPAYMVRPEALVPDRINDLPTDVVESGEVRPLALTGKYRPVTAGVSIGPEAWTDASGATWVSAGTAGCLVERNLAIHILSCNHVLLNRTGSGVGSPIYQPALADSGSPSTDRVAKLSHWVTLNTLGWNSVDCAMAKVDANSLVTPEIECLPTILGLVPWFTATLLGCSRGLLVAKCGRTTGLTYGQITDCSYDVASTSLHFFRNQIRIKPTNGSFAEHGDSGSVVYWPQGISRAMPVGLLWGGDSTGSGFGTASPIGLVLNALGASIAYSLS
jgi:hypothetical protein